MQTNSINSYLSSASLNHINTLNSQQEKTKNSNETLAKTNNATQAINLNITQTNTLNSNISNLVQDKNKAVSQVLGYGVDKEGFFTSDFNEKLNLPKEYKIYSKDMQELLNQLLQNKHFSNIDFEKTLQNVSKIFNQIMSYSSEDSLSKEQIQSLPLGFKYDRKNLNVLEIYNDINQLNKAVSKDETSAFFSKNTQNSFSFSSYSSQKYENYTSIQKNANSYIKENGSISKGGIFVAFAKNQLNQNENGFLISGQTTISGKLMGFDTTISKEDIRSLNDFIESNSFLGDSNSVKTLEEGIAYMSKILDLFSSDLSIDEFKTQWQKLQNKEASQTQNELKSIETIIENEKENIKGRQNTKTNKTTFTPIQAESKNETYKAIDTNELLKKLLEESFDEKDFLKMLFGIKDENLNLKSLD
ncbi:hypothetical protein DMB95_09540, partial [Campylobacter sp. MIT 12-8780]